MFLEAQVRARGRALEACQWNREQLQEVGARWLNGSKLGAWRSSFNRKMGGAWVDGLDFGGKLNNPLTMQLPAVRRPNAQSESRRQSNKPLTSSTCISRNEGLLDLRIPISKMLHYHGRKERGPHSLGDSCLNVFRVR